LVRSRFWAILIEKKSSLHFKSYIDMWSERIEKPKIRTAQEPLPIHGDLVFKMVVSGPTGGSKVGYVAFSQGQGFAQNKEAPTLPGIDEPASLDGVRRWIILNWP